MEIISVIFLNLFSVIVMHPFYTICLLCVIVTVTHGSMNMGLLINKAEKEYLKQNVEYRVLPTPGPPPHEQAARMARYIVHNSG